MNPRAMVLLAELRRIESWREDFERREAMRSPDARHTYRWAITDHDARIARVRAELIEVLRASPSEGSA